MFIHFCKHLNQKNNQSNGWNNLHKRAVSKWYNSKSDDKLVYLLTKYKNRHSYEHKDVFRLSHIVPDGPGKDLIYKYIIKGLAQLPIESGFKPETKAVYEYLDTYERLFRATEESTVVDILINKQKDLCASYAWEHVPTTFLNSAEVLKTLLPNMPKIALLRNLNRLTRAGVLDDMDSKTIVLKKLQEMTNVHPIQVLITLKMYSKGAGDKGSTSWVPNQAVVDKLSDAFERMFNEITPIKKNVCVALDVSGSMFGTHTVSGADCLVAAEVGCAMTMVLQKAMESSGSNVDVMGFSREFVELPISHKRRLDDNMRAISNLPFNSTDCSLPMRWALEKKKNYDAFIIITDNETNCNKETPSAVLRRYREMMKKPDAKMVVIATAANSFSIADPSDKNMLDVSGFDASVPDLVCQFIVGDV
jgi:60 kDa SS-A/Ro ribonucleoprotein